MNEHKTRSAADLTALFVIAFIALCFAGLTAAGVVITNERYKQNIKALEPPHSHNLDSAYIKTEFHVMNGDTTYVHVRTDRVLDWERLTSAEKKLFLE